MNLRYYAEDVALIMELRNDGVPWKRIGQVYGKTADAMVAVVQRAKRRGFDAYPPMAKKSPVELLLDTGVSG